MEEKVFYNSTDGTKLCGLISKVNNSKEIIILCHGLISNKESKNFNALVKELQLNNINSFRFDFRGIGESGSDFVDMTPTKEVADLEATISYIKNLGYEKINLLGTSFGGSIVALLNYKEYNYINSIIFWYSALDYLYNIDNNYYFSISNKEIADKKGFVEIINKKSYKLGKDLFKEVYSLIPYKNIINLDLPILFVHGLKDETVPSDLSVKVSKMCKKAQLELIKNGTHSFRDDNNSLKKAIDVTVAFIKTVNL